MRVGANEQGIEVNDHCLSARITWDECLGATGKTVRDGWGMRGANGLPEKIKCLGKVTKAFINPPLFLMGQN
jgi:hypothetical protein